MTYYIQGLIWGLAYVAPIGLQNLFVINTALTQKRSRVYLTALVVVFFDITLAAACFYGVGALIAQSLLIKKIVLLVGSIIVVFIGFQLVRAKGEAKTDTNVNVSFLKAVVMACAVTWFNPQALVDGAMMLGAFHATLPSGQSTEFITGVITASFCWFFGISTILSFFHQLFTDKILRVINVVCGVVILLYGLKLFVQFILMLLP